MEAVAGQSADLVLKNYIAGRFEEGGRRFDTYSPFDGSKTGEVYEASEAQVDKAVGAARASLQGEWGQMTPKERFQYLHRIGEVMKSRAEDLIAAEVRDTGRPIAQARQRDMKAADLFAQYAHLAGSLRDEAHRFGADGFYFTARRPKGVIACIAPWNMPLLLMVMKLAPALAMGNAVIAKPSEETPGSAAVLAECIDEAGLPEGVFQLLHGFGTGSTGAWLTAHPGIDAFSFTGESGTGEAIMKAAASGLREVSLELGGKNPSLIFADADLEAAVEGTKRSAFFNCGQICFCTERVYVERPIFADFVARLKTEAESVIIGDPQAEGFSIGPLISKAHREKVLSYFEAARGDGAEFITGGGIPEFQDERDRGFFIQPTVLTGLSETSRVVREEIFGPVCHIAPFDDEDEAVSLANDTEYGLSACLWSRDISRVHRLVPRLQAGHVWVNAWQLRDFLSPLAGHGRSGLGTAFGRASLEFCSEHTTVTVKI